MTLDDTDDFDIVATNPAAYYNSPQEVFDDPCLAYEQKLRLLEEWEIDLIRQLESDAEGMAQGTHLRDETDRANDAVLLKQASNYRLRAVEEGPGAAGETPIGRVWLCLLSNRSPRAVS